MLLRRSPAHLRQCPLRLAEPRLQFGLCRGQRSVFRVRRQPHVRQRVLACGQTTFEIRFFRGELRMPPLHRDRGIPHFLADIGKTLFQIRLRHTERGDLRRQRRMLLAGVPL